METGEFDNLQTQHFSMDLNSFCHFSKTESVADEHQSSADIGDEKGVSEVKHTGHKQESRALSSVFQFGSSESENDDFLNNIDSMYEDVPMTAHMTSLMTKDIRLDLSIQEHLNMAAGPSISFSESSQTSKTSDEFKRFTSSPRSKRRKMKNDPPVDHLRFDENLIGDYSRPFCLPRVIDPRHNLQSITSETLRKLLNKEFDDLVDTYKIIDCRYPFEYEGGHITEALNLYSHEQILDQLVRNKPDPHIDGMKRNILVFHCEFSSERGPKLLKFLRNHDRKLNTYPILLYPEIYLLIGGYKAFYETNRDLCEPQCYRSMLETKYANEYKLFKSEPWTKGSRALAGKRMAKSLSRLRL